MSISPSQQWVTSITNVSGEAASFAFGTTDVSGTRTVGSVVGSGCPSIGTPLRLDQLGNPNAIDFLEPDPPAGSWSFGGDCTMSPESGTISTLALAEPVLGLILHVTNLEASRLIVGGTSTTGAPIQLSPISTNDALEITGNEMNSGMEPVQNAGCELNDGTNPAGGCGSIMLTAASGFIQSFTLDNNTLDPPYAISADDAWAFSLSFPTATLTKSFADAEIAPGAATALTFTIDNPSGTGSVALSPIDFTDSLPAGLTIASDIHHDNGACGSPTVTDAAAGSLDAGDIGVEATNISVASGATCEITVYVTTDTPGSYTNDTSNLSSGVGNVVVNGSATVDCVDCPAGDTAQSMTGHAQAWTPDSTWQVDTHDPALALNAPDSTGIQIYSQDPDGDDDIFTLDLATVVPENEVVTLHLGFTANSIYNGSVFVESSPDGVTFGGGAVVTPTAADPNFSEHEYVVPAGGARYVRFTPIDNGGNGTAVRVDAVSYSFAFCECDEAVNLVQQASFEEFDDCSTQSGDFGAWSVIGTNIHVWGSTCGASGWPVPDGTNSIDLDGGTTGGMEQLIGGLVPGNRYNLTWYQAFNPASGATSASMRVEVADFSAIYTSASSANDGGFNRVHVEFTATGETEMLRFVSLTDGSVPGLLDGGGTAGFGVVIDNVQITPKDCAAQVPYDFGDAPSGYLTTLVNDGPRHAVPGYDDATNSAPLMLGSTIDTELDGMPTVAADGDGVDEDALSLAPNPASGAPTTVVVEVTNTTLAEATLAGWIDLDGDGILEAAERATATVPAGTATTHDLVFAAATAPVGTVVYARFRLFEGNVADPQPTGLASAGEVEDYSAEVMPPTFSCTATAYLFQGSPLDVTSINLVTGADNFEANDIYPAGNAFGYNTLDNYIYGWDSPNQHAVWVDSTFTATSLPTPSNWGSYAFLAGGGFQTAAFGTDGTYWMARGSSNPLVWAQIDFRPGSATFNQVLQAGQATMPPSGNVLGDWALNLADGDFYSLAHDSATGNLRLYRFSTDDLAVHEEFDFGVIIPTATGFGSIFADANGFLYGLLNSNGDIIRVDMDNPSDRQSFASGPALAGDGAMCGEAILPIDFGDAPDTYGTSLAEDGPRHDVVGHDPNTNEAPLMLGASVDIESDGTPSVAADGDGADEDGLTGPVVVTAGQPTTLPVAVTNATTEPATLAVWVDFDRDGTFTDAERFTEAIPASSGAATYDVDVIAGGMVLGATYARIRLFPGAVADPQPTGSAGAGEVEDYIATLEPAPIECNVAGNGSFEDPDIRTEPGTTYENGHAMYLTGLPEINGWTVVSGNVDLVREWANPSDGAQSVDLFGTQASVIEQTFEGLTPGQSYTFSIDLSGHSVTASWADLLLDTGSGFNVITRLHPLEDGVLNAPGTYPRLTLSWETYSLTFTAGTTSATIRFANAPTAASTGTGLFIDNFVFSGACTDYGDAPDGYLTSLTVDGARHALPDYDEGTGTAPLMLGTTVDAEGDGAPTAAADGDGADEDAVSSSMTMDLGFGETFEVTATNTSSQVATLVGWIDLDGNGVLAATERVSATVPANSGTMGYSLAFPKATEAGTLYARFRLFPGTVVSPQTSGSAAAGEVEDYVVVVPLPLVDCSFDTRSFSTGYDPTTGEQLTAGSRDALWDVAVVYEDDDSPDPDGPATPTEWLSPYVGRYTGSWAVSPFDNAQWISAYPSATHGGANNWADAFFRYRFELSPSLDPAAFALAIDFYADNSVWEVYINGQPQSSILDNVPQEPDNTLAYGHAGFTDANRASTVLTQDWQTGTNELIVHVKSRGPQMGFLAQVTSSGLCADYGDAPAGYGTLVAADGPLHLIPGIDEAAGSAPLMLGTSIDVDFDGQPTTAADGDGADEDAIGAPIVLTAGQTTDLAITVTNDTVDPVTLAGWIDYDGDGVFEDVERFLVLISALSGTATYTVGQTPDTVTPGTSYARFRLFPGEVDDPDPVGPAVAGEVEDYSVALHPMPFACTADGLLFQGGNPLLLQEIDMVTGGYQTIEIDSDNINAVGYNVLDDYVYGWDGTRGGIVRVGSDGGVEFLGAPVGYTGPGSGMVIGDVDQSGHYWLTTTGSASWWQIDLDPGSPTFLEVLDSGTPTGLVGGAGADWADVPGAGDYLFRVMSANAGAEARLVALNRATGNYEDLGALGNLGGTNTFGAVYAADGYLYASNNTTGVIWRIDVGAVSATVFSSGPASTSNDGARCASAPLPIDFGDAPDTYDTSLAEDGPRHAVPEYEAAGTTAPVMLGAAIDIESDGAPSAAADGDGVDEDGVEFNPAAGYPGPTLRTGTDPATGSAAENVLVVTATAPGYASVWVDWSGDGDFLDAGEQVAASQAVAAGSTDITFQQAVNAPSIFAHVRVRYSTDPTAVASSTGPAPDGEVEDYRVLVERYSHPESCADSAATHYAFTFTEIEDLGSTARYSNVSVIDGVAVDLLVERVSGSLAGGGFGVFNGDDAGFNMNFNLDVRYTFVEAGTTTPVPVNAVFTVSDLDSGERAIFQKTDIAGYSVTQGSAVTITETATHVTFSGNGSWNGHPESRFQFVLEGISSLVVQWRGFQNSGFFLDGDGDLAIGPAACEDFGDAPNSYATLLANDGPRHTVTPALRLGDEVEFDPNGQPGANALGDDLNRLGDEDGVAAPITLVPGGMTTVSVSATNETSQAATLAGWLDLDRDGTFEAAERVVTTVPAGSATASYDLAFPSPSRYGDTYARFRLLPGVVVDPQPIGSADGGEVEDYVVTAAPLPPPASCEPEVTRATERYWFFGNRGGIDFETTGITPTAVLGTQNTLEGSTVVTDATGQLLFWSNGQSVFDRNGSAMPNGTGLLGNPSATQTVAAFPAIGVPGRYFVVTTSTEVGSAPNGTLHYSMVEMTLNAGLGAVTATKNVQLGVANTAAEALTAVPNEAGTGFWVLTYTNNSTNVLAYEFDDSGPTGTVVTSTLPTANHNWYGTLNFSADLTQLVALTASNTGVATVRLLGFDAATGSVYERLQWNLPTVAGSGTYGYSADFSPSGAYVYASRVFGGPQLYRYDVGGALTGAEVKATEEDLGEIGSTGGQVRRAPDGRMYVANRPAASLSVVNDPDNATTPGFVAGGFALAGGSASQFGLPQTVTGCPETVYMDFGDTPDSYGTSAGVGGPSHIIDGYDPIAYDAPIKLGPSIDAELEGVPSVNADSDDQFASTDDEDGVAFNPALGFTNPTLRTGLDGVGQPLSNTLEVSPSADGYLGVWVDWNLDGDFTDPGEQVVAAEAVTAGTDTVSFSRGTNPPQTSTYVRVRYSTDPDALASPTGSAPDGEVEDFRVLVERHIWAESCISTPSFRALTFAAPVETTGSGGLGTTARYGEVTVVGGISVDMLVEVTAGALASAPGVSVDDATWNPDPSATLTYTFVESGTTTPIAVNAMFTLNDFDTGDEARFLSSELDDYFFSEGSAVSVSESGGEVIFTGDGLWGGEPESLIQVALTGVSSFSASWSGSLFAADGDGDLSIEPTACHDYGDAPLSYDTTLAEDGPRHRVSPALYLGGEADVDADGVHDIDADGDDDANLDDEDAVSGPIVLVDGEATSVDVSVSNFVSDPATLAWWVDLDGNGSFDAGERNVLAIPAASGTATYSLPMPAGTLLTPETFVRFRLFPGDVADPQPTGAADGGEVEDHLVLVSSVHYRKTVSPNDQAELVPNQVHTYTVTVTNEGSTDLTGLSLTDDLSEVIDDAAYVVDSEAADIGTVTFVAPDRIEWSGDLLIGQVATITYQIEVDDPVTGNGAIVNGVVGTGPSSNCPPPGPHADPDCYTHLPTPVITTTKMVLSPTGEPEPGDVVQYEVSFSNSGTGDAVNLTITDKLGDVLDDATYNDDLAVTSGPAGTTSFDADGETITWNGTLPAGQSVTMTYSFTVKAADELGNGVLVNAMVSPDCPEPAVTDPSDPLFDADCVTIDPIEAHSVEKSSDASGPVEPGDIVSYTLIVTNTGGVDLFDVGIDDDLSEVIDDADYNHDATAGGIGALNYIEPTLTWSGDLAVDQVVTITYSVTVNDADQLGDGRLVNAVTGGDCPDPAITDPADPDFDPDCAVIDDVAAYTVVKNSDAADPALPGDTVTYTLIVTNTGNLALDDPLDLPTATDDLSDVLDDAAYNADADAGGDGALAYSQPVLVWAGELEVDQVVTITYSVTVNDADQLGDGRLANAVTGGDCPDPAITDPADPDFDPDCVVIDPIRAWTSVKTSDASGPVEPGDIVRYTLSVTNTGGVDLAAAEVLVGDDLSEVLDDAAYNGDADQGATYAEPVISWSGDLAVDQVVTISYSVTVNAADALGDGRLRNAVTGGDCPDPAITDPADPDFDPDCVVIDDVGAWVAVKSSDATGPVEPGDTVTYAVRIENTGNLALDDPLALPAVTDDLTEVLDDAAYNSDADDGGQSGTFTYSGPVLSWRGPLAAGEVVVLTYSVTVNGADGLGDGLLVNALAGSPNCSVSSVAGVGGAQMPPGCTTIAEVAAWTALKTSDAGDAVDPGDEVTYTITVTNTGGADLSAADVELTDDLSDVLDDATYNADADSGGVGNLAWSSPVLSWSGDLAEDAVVTLSYSVTVMDDDELGDRLLVNAVTGALNCADPAVSDPDDPAYRIDCVVRDAVASANLPDTALEWLFGTESLVPLGGLGGIILAGTALSLAAVRRRRSGGASRRPRVG